MNEISNCLEPLPPIRCTVGLDAPALTATVDTCAEVAGRTSVVVTLLPDVKSIPSFSPRPPTASAPTSRITPDIVKK